MISMILSKKVIKIDPVWRGLRRFMFYGILDKNKLTPLPKAKKVEGKKAKKASKPEKTEVDEK